MSKSPMTAPEAMRLVRTQFDDEEKRALVKAAGPLEALRNQLTSDQQAWLPQLVQVVRQARKRRNPEANTTILRIFNQIPAEDRNTMASTVLLTLASEGAL